eukprot:1585099-Ditylum_brightwellii.AAC.1
MTWKALFIFWDKGSRNDADYFTKHRLPAHHRIKRKRYILKGLNVHQPLRIPTYTAAYIQK